MIDILPTRDDEMSPISLSKFHPQARIHNRCYQGF